MSDETMSNEPPGVGAKQPGVRGVRSRCEGEGEQRCPQKIEIRKQLKECLEVFGNRP